MDIIVQVDLKDLDLTEEISAYYDEDGDRCGGKTIAEAVIASLVTQASKGDAYKGLKTRVEEIRDEEIRIRIAADVEAALTEPIHLTNSYGQSTGTVVTLHEVIVKTAEKWLSESTRDYGARDSTRRIDALVHQQVDAAFKAEIADAVKAAKESVAKQLGKSISDVVAEAVKTGLTPRR